MNSKLVFSFVLIAGLTTVYSVPHQGVSQAVGKEGLFVTSQGATSGPVSGKESLTLTTSNQAENTLVNTQTASLTNGPTSGLAGSVTLNRQARQFYPGGYGGFGPSPYGGFGSSNAAASASSGTFGGGFGGPGVSFSNANANAGSFGR